MEIIKQVFKQTSWQVVGKIINSLTTILILSLITRSYSVSDTGVFTLVLTYLSFFYFASDLGLNAYLMPAFLDKQTLEKSWNKLLGFRFIWSLILMLIALGLLPVLPFSTPPFGTAVLIAATAIILQSFYLTTQALFQKESQLQLSTYAQILGSFTSLAILLWLLNLRLPISLLLFAHLFGWVVCSLVALVLVKGFIKHVRPQFDLSFVWQTIKAVWPLSLTLLISLVYFRVDAFILSSFRSFEEVGIYNLAFSVFQSALLISTFIVNSYYPLMLQALQKGKKHFLSSLRLAVLLMAGIAFIGTLSTQLLAPLIINLIAGGSSFLGSVPALKILSLGYPAFFVSTILMWTVITLRRYYLLVSIYLGGLVFNVTFNLLYIPKYSYLAASWITVISEYLILITLVITLAYTLNVKTQIANRHLKPALPAGRS